MSNGRVSSDQLACRHKRPPRGQRVTKPRLLLFLASGVLSTGKGYCWAVRGYSCVRHGMLIHIAFCGVGLRPSSRILVAYSPRRWGSGQSFGKTGRIGASKFRSGRLRSWSQLGRWKVSVGQVGKREPPPTGAPGARVGAQRWLQGDCDVKRRRKVPFTTFPANSSAAFAARLAPAAAVRAPSS